MSAELRDLISAELFEQLAEHVMKDEGHDWDLVGRSDGSMLGELGSAVWIRERRVCGLSNRSIHASRVHGPDHQQEPRST